ncbi:unnamed protein product [Brassicogethes aeneus]|uniref:Uncharacterized protein n=1 Tax=Brassicogethes aeneus TaxID=1431903 RepID=A0A9P0B7Y2_BRAAE|nr:unnamed protein product [Brassicogethes aeneus]
MTEEEVALFRRREMDSSVVLPKNIVYLFVSNKEVDSFNDARLESYETERAESIAVDVVKGSCTDKVKEDLLRRARELPKQDCMGLMFVLKLQVDAKDIVSININTNDGIVNGAAGFLRKIDYDDQKRPRLPWMEKSRNHWVRCDDISAQADFDNTLKDVYLMFLEKLS